MSSSAASAFAKTLPQSLSSRTVLVKCTPAPRSLAERRAILKGLLMTGQRPEIEVFRQLDDDSSFIAVAATAATATCLVDDSPFRRVMVTAPARAGATAQATAAWGSAAAAPGAAGSSSPSAAAAAPLAEPVVVQVLKKNEKTKDPSKRPLWWRKREEKRMKEAAERQAAEKLAAEQLQQQQQQQALESGDAAAAAAAAVKSGADESLSVQKKEFVIHVFPANKGFNHQRMLGRGLLHGPWPLNINQFLASGDGHQDQAELRDTFISAALRKSVPPGRLAPSLKDWDTGRQMAIGRGTATGFDDRAAWELLGVGVHGASFIQHRLHQKDIAAKTPAVMRSLAAMSRQGQYRQRWNSYGQDEEEGGKPVSAKEKAWDEDNPNQISPCIFARRGQALILRHGVLDGAKIRHH
ncbi:hypothetical protein PG997_004393 [Apiospora hydei]|uniref:Uncharacterized protein n=1 Tax=Apiospora hydei TaxID=1337664 RepID=A0ABR1X268_9PEZI